MKQSIILSRLLLALLGVAVIVGGLYAYKTFTVFEPTTPTQKFSDIEELDQNIFALIDHGQVFPYISEKTLDQYDVEAGKNKERLSDKDEIAYLISLKDKRTPELIQTHTTEYERIDMVPIGDKTFGDYINPKTKPLSFELYALLVNDLDVTISVQKIVNDVARPMQVSTEVDSPVPTPKTPSFPSLFAARAQLGKELLLRLASTEEESLITNSFDSAIERKNIVGISTRHDTDYGAYIAHDYFNHVFETQPNVQRLLELAIKYEWSGDSNTNWPIVSETVSSESTATMDITTSRPDVLVVEAKLSAADQDIDFSSTLKNVGLVPAPKTLVTLEIDTANDGSVDILENTSVAQFEPWLETKISFSKALKELSDGTHSFRIVVNDEPQFTELRQLNNYGGWVTFTIENGQLVENFDEESIPEAI